MKTPSKSTRWLWVVAGFAILLLLALFSVPSARPKFDRHSRPKREKYLNLDYPFLNAIPFSHGLTWVWVNPNTNSFHFWLLDLGAGKVKGELLNIYPLMLDGTGTKLLGTSIKSPPTRLKQWFQSVLVRFNIGGKPSEEDIYWVLDLVNGEAELLSKIASSEMHSTIVSSPDGDRAYLMYAFPNPAGQPFLLFDLKAGSMTTNLIQGWPCGWWSHNEIAYKNSSNNFEIYNVDTRQKGILLEEKSVQDWFAKEGIHGDPKTAGLIANWDGHRYRFYLADPREKWSANTSYLAEFKGDEPRLNLLDPEFKFEWSDHFDSEQRFYVYSGRQSGDWSSAVFLRDLQTHTERILVPEDKAYFSIPNFYSNSVVFIRNNMLWKIDVNGSNLTRLFPPENLK